MTFYISRSKTITLVYAKELSLERIVQDYNVTIETFWHLQQQLYKEKQEDTTRGGCL